MNAALVAATVPVGPLVIIVSGGVRSTIHVRVAGDGSFAPAAVCTRTWNVWLPSDRPFSIADNEHTAKIDESSAQLWSQASNGIVGTPESNDGFGGRSLKEYERRWRALLGPDIRAGLAFRAIAARLTDGAVDRLVELASVEGPGRLAAVLKQTADFNWHRSAASALLRHAEFRRIVLGAIWG